MITKANRETWVQITELFMCKIVIILLSISLNICLGYSKEPSHEDGSSEYPQHVFWLKNNKMSFQLHTFTWKAGEIYKVINI